MTYSLPPAGAVGKIFYMPPEVFDELAGLKCDVINIISMSRSIATKSHSTDLVPTFGQQE